MVDAYQISGEESRPLTAIDRSLSHQLSAPIADELKYNWDGLHYLHTLVRCFTTGAHIHTNALGSFFAIQVQQEGPEQSFDYGDLYIAQSMMLRLGSFAFVVSFNDGGGAVQFLKQKLIRITDQVSGLQLRELSTELAFLNVHLKAHPTFESHFDLARELHRLEGKPVDIELGELDYSIRGKFMHYVFRDMLGKLKSPKFNDAALEDQLLAGRLTFLFDENGEFVTDRRVISP